MSIEDELELALRAEAARIDPPVAGLVDGGVARGRAMQRRHRARLAAGGAALALVAGAGTVLAVPFLDGDDGGTDADPVVAAPPGAETSAEIDPEALLDTVVALLPPGRVIDPSTDANSASSAWFQFGYDDGAGESWFMGSASVWTDPEPPACPVIVNGGSCEVRTLDDGTTLMLMAGPYYPQPDREPERLHWSTAAVTPDGLSVVLGEMNAPTEKDSEPTRAEPPLTLDQLAAVVTDGAWVEMTAGVTPAPWPDDDATDSAVITDEARAFAAVLGPDWLPDDVSAQPAPDLAAGLPAGYTVGWATFDRLGPELTLEQHCLPGEEKGAVKDACVTATAPGGETVHVQWGGTVPDGPYAQDSLEDRVTVLIEGEGGLDRVSLWVADTAGDSTPDRRAAARAWLEEQLDDLSRAAVAVAAGELG